ncbi:kinase-like domain-containing protein [Chaetomium sp. MPI-CAGE-AT-0009]|nr:kinase-like domain-containing protein [Chaetomium sp. MPI-CAGE-AT-0009]
MATFAERQKQSNFRFREYRRDGIQDVNFQSDDYLTFDVPQPGVRQHLRRRLLPRGLHWSKDLGIGGNGLASLFFLDDGSPKSRRQYFVAKCNHSGGAAANAILREEKNKTDEFQDAMHIIQTSKIPSMQSLRSSQRVRARKGPQASRRWSRADRNLTGIMLLEYCQRGSLHKALCVSDKKDIEFPERALWHMFHCLIKGLTAMAYPPHRHGYLYNGLLPPYMEQIPEDEEKARWIHFDIDPHNVLVNKSDSDSDHPLVPALKFSDFGLAAELNEQDLRDNDHMLMYRSWAKHFFFTPEQFSAEWDYIPRNRGPGTTHPRPRTAGNFTWKTNLFQVGAVMACLITRSYLPTPPWPERTLIPGRGLDPSYHSDSPEGDDVPDALRTADGYLQVWSYGQYLLSDEDRGEDESEYGHVSPTLRQLVAQCLADDPRYRPSLAWLEQQISDHIREQWAEEPDDGESAREVREWIKECLDAPLPKQPR